MGLRKMAKLTAEEKAKKKEAEKRKKEGIKMAEKRAKAEARLDKIREKEERKAEKARAKENKRRAKKGLPPLEEEKKTPEFAPKKVETKQVEPAIETPTVSESEEVAVAEEMPSDEVSESDSQAPIEEKKARPINYHISLREDGRWQVKKAKGERAIKLFSTQAEAIAFAKERAERMDGSVTIHKKDGKIRKQNYNK